MFLVKILQGLVGIIFAFFLRAVIDSAVNGDGREFYLYLSLGSGIIVAEVVLYWLAIYYKEKPTAVLARNLRASTFRELLTRSYPDVSKVHTGEWMTRINSDAVIVGGAITSLVPGTAGLLVQLVCAFGAMFLVLPRMAWALIPLGAGMVVISLFMRVKLKAFHLEVQKNEGISWAYLQESLGSMPIIRTYARQDRTYEEAYQKLDGIVSAKLRRARFISFCSSAVYALIRVSYFLGVAVCGFRLLRHVITYGMMAAVLQLIRQADLPLAEVTTAVPRFFNMIASAERLMEIERLEPDLSGDAVSADEARRFYEEELFAVGFRDVSFSYQKEGTNVSEVLSGMNMEVKKGDYVAFTGESGCGKSTTMNLLMGLYRPDRGMIYLRDKKGHEQVLDAGWRTLFAYVPQENLLMSGKIREVVTFSDANAAGQDRLIWHALEVACADEFVGRLPDGLDTRLGEHGAGLSEGQMQRIAIARAVFSRRPILMLDESTSALDEQTERRLLDNLKSMTDRTVIIITHRPAALSICTERIHFSGHEG
ncbi:MAG: ABC transporter ATP-binding protein [Lachnospiraceae bacterium]|nr:ABC transporter ATP-binding protein [Lachnospiraceae bacterium]